MASTPYRTTPRRRSVAVPGNDASDILCRGLALNLDLLVGAISRLGTPDLLALGGARLAAFAAIAGTSGWLLAFAEHIPSEAVQVALPWIGVAGFVLFGLAHRGRRVLVLARRP